MNAAVSRGQFITNLTHAASYPTSAEAIRARVDAAHRMLELAHTVSDAKTIRYSIAVALADMAARGDDLSIVTAEYAKSVAAEEYAAAAHQQALEELAEVRLVVPLSA